MEGRTDGQTLFYRNLPAEAEGPITSQCIVFTSYLMIFFYFMEKSFSVLEIFNFLNLDHFINFKSCDVIMSINTRSETFLNISFES